MSNVGVLQDTSTCFQNLIPIDTTLPALPTHPILSTTSFSPLIHLFHTHTLHISSLHPNSIINASLPPSHPLILILAISPEHLPKVRPVTRCSSTYLLSKKPETCQPAISHSRLQNKFPIELIFDFHPPSTCMHPLACYDTAKRIGQLDVSLAAVPASSVAVATYHALSLAFTIFSHIFFLRVIQILCCISRGCSDTGDWKWIRAVLVCIALVDVLQYPAFLSLSSSKGCWHCQRMAVTARQLRF